MPDAPPAAYPLEQGISVTSTVERALAFSDEYVQATLVTHASNYRVATGIVVNLSTEPMIIGGDVKGVVPPWKSTILRDGIIEKADQVAIFNVSDKPNLGGLVFGKWDWFGDLFAKFPRTTPLYVSRYDEVGDVQVDPYHFTHQAASAMQKQGFDVKVKLWWAPPGTDCYIHNEHPFLEVHTQIHGSGRMQKFRGQDDTTLYEQVHMSPGLTHDSFAYVESAQKWGYPWHRYFSDTDCIWLAIELHPKN
jgi:hypothetical protein